MNKKFIRDLFASHEACKNCPTPRDVADIFDRLLGLLFPNFASQGVTSEEILEDAFEQLHRDLLRLLAKAPSSTVDTFFESLPEIYSLLREDVEALYAGDPAAKSREEVIRSYPGFYAIAAYRVAHALVELQVPNIPRSITEHAHSKTGIDIHPGATIGRRFCIDHGTGVVIGESTIIGDDVKIYQGVTLGALSVDKGLANTKRHPTIENGVILYAGATVLGGNTVVGEHSIVGGNVWLTRSIPANSRVYYKATVEQTIANSDKLIIK